MWRKVQEFGLATVYHADDDTRLYVRKLMALPLVPKEHIRPLFETLKDDATSTALKNVVQYIQDTWIESNIWDIENWCMFYQAIRTNNDVGGWHNRLNRHAGNRPNLPFYLLIQLLYEEARNVNLQLRLLKSNKHKKRVQKSKFRKMQAKLYELWNKRRAKDLSPMQ